MIAATCTSTQPSTAPCGTSLRLPRNEIVAGLDTAARFRREIIQISLTQSILGIERVPRLIRKL